MKEISNKVLMYVLFIAIVVSVGSTMFSLGKLAKSPAYTGMATTSGTVDVSITSTYVVNVTDNNINFGAGQLDDGVENCQLTSVNGDASGCSSFTHPNDEMNFENIGSNNINVTINGTNAASFIGGDHAEFKFACGGNGQCTGTDDINGTLKYCCNVLPSSGTDTGELDILLNVSTGATTGASQATVYFWAEKA